MTRPKCDHLLQFYENEEFLYNRVAEFLADGLKQGQPLVVIATETHGRGFIKALRALGLNPEALRALGRLVLLDARETLATFMGDRLPDEGRFATHVGGVIAKASRQAAHNGVRAYGEMVDLLYSDGNPDGAIRLEQCWNTLAQTHAFTLLCAYGMEGFATESQSDRFSEICALHSHVSPIDGDSVSSDQDRRNREISRLQQRARALEAEIERRKALERSLQEATVALQEADRRKDEFLATLAHELRNPLAPIQNALQMIRAGGVDEQAGHVAADVIARQMRQLTRLVDDLLDLSRITTGRLELRKRRLELRELLHAAVETSLPLIEGGGHELVTTMPSDAIYVDGDLTRLSQVIANLLNNAAKYSDPHGCIRLTAEARADRVVVSVSDTGIGIAPEMLPRVFDMFTQGDAARDRAQGGLGIGLNLSKRLIDMHGGTIAARSEGVGHGSTFTIELPRAQAPARPTLSLAVQPERVHRTPGLRILVVDDNADAADSMAMLLQFHGHDTRTASDGVQAVTAAELFRPHVVLLDIGLPRMNGHEAACEIRRQPWAKQTALIAMSGWGQDADRQRSRDAGFDHHLVKPVDHDVLGHLLATVEPAEPAAMGSA